MKFNLRACCLGVYAIGAALGLATSSASAQGLGSGGSLGGYGAASSYGAPGMGNIGGGGAMVIPYGGMTEGFMPSRMGGGSPLAFRSRPTAAMSSSRTTFSLSPMLGGMSSTSGVSRPMLGGMGRGIGASSSMSVGFPGSQGLGSGSFRLGSGGGAKGVMPSSIGYPFRQPPSLLSPSSGSNGMPM
jgi:hypothetical protein